VSNSRSKPTSSTVTGWRVFQSSAGRWWGSREQPWPPDVEQQPEMWRTLDANTFGELVLSISHQEALAALAVTP
jgi:hypothetical protein